MEHLAVFLKEFLHPMAEISASVLELIGILIIIIGSCSALFKLLKNLWQKREFHVVVALGKALSLALEFKMGAEIIKTVIVHDLTELAVLGIVILIRALLAFLIHWEMKMENKHDEPKDKKSDDKE